MSFKTSLDEYTKEEIEKNGNGMYGGKRHDEICDYLQKSYGFSESEINNISMGVWLGIQSEKAVHESRKGKAVHKSLNKWGSETVCKIQNGSKSFASSESWDEVTCSNCINSRS